MNSILLFGSPNVGKTSIFNALTNSSEKISNFEGATVVRKSARIIETNIDLVDLPGVDSINGDTIVEEVVFNELINGEMVISVMDATNFKRNSYMLLEILELNKPVSVVLNMMDLYKGTIDTDIIAEKYCVHVETALKDKRGINHSHLVVPHKNTFFIDYGEEMEEAIAKIENLIDVDVQNRFLAIQFLKGNKLADQFISNIETASQIRENLASNVNAKSIAGHVFNIRRKFINEVMEEAFNKEEVKNEMKFLNDHFDKIALHKVWGFVLFFFVMWSVFFIRLGVLR